MGNLPEIKSILSYNNEGHKFKSINVVSIIWYCCALELGITRLNDGLDGVIRLTVFPP